MMRIRTTMDDVNTPFTGTNEQIKYINDQVENFHDLYSRNTNPIQNLVWLATARAIFVDFCPYTLMLAIAGEMLFIHNIRSSVKQLIATYSWATKGMLELETIAKKRQYLHNCIEELIKTVAPFIGDVEDIYAYALSPNNNTLLSAERLNHANVSNIKTHLQQYSLFAIEHNSTATTPTLEKSSALTIKTLKCLLFGKYKKIDHVFQRTITTDTRQDININFD